MTKQKLEGISFFELYMTLWVAMCMVAGVLIGRFAQDIPDFLCQFE